MDNQSAISQITSEASSYKSKHVDIKHKFIKDIYKKGTIMPTYIPTAEKKADILTKALPTPVFRTLQEMIGLFSDVESTSTRCGGVLESTSKFSDTTRTK